MPRESLPLYKRVPEYGEPPPDFEQEENDGDAEERGVYNSSINEDHGRAVSSIDMNPNRDDGEDAAAE